MLNPSEILWEGSRQENVKTVQRLVVGVFVVDKLTNPNQHIIIIIINIIVIINVKIIIIIIINILL